MLLHEFRPGRLVAGSTALATAALYLGDAAGAWETAWFVAFPIVVGGLFLATVTTYVHYRLRRRSAMGASTGNVPAPVRSNGGEATR
ncbi:hypothetical protein [Streptomyces sp. NPDC059176]|uniref:hypothetical protein n=1 Tax=unclassified Streptomyces TaxID=2593676 RepID=UPI003686B262